MYSRCKYCKISHDRGIAHLYSQKHKKQIKYLLRKFKVKVKDAKLELAEPIIKARISNTGVKFWCYFCEVDLCRDLVLDEAVVQNWSLLQHISRIEHSEKVDLFWKNQRIRDQTTEKYCLDEKLFSEYEKLSTVRVEEYVKEKKERIKMQAIDLKLQEEKRKQDAFMTDNNDISSMANETWQERRDNHRGDHTNQRGFRTVAAKGEGLACISISSDKTFRGNIYTGVTPPWEVGNDDNSVTSKKEIGPNLEDYEKHLEFERRRKLPACRVGANNIEISGPNWLPSFGRVWSKNTRQHQRKWLSRGAKYFHKGNNQEFHRQQNPYSSTVNYGQSSSNSTPSGTYQNKATKGHLNSQDTNGMSIPGCSFSHRSSANRQVSSGTQGAYVRKTHTNNIGSGKIEIASNLL